ncbi:MAG: lactate utilization protein [Acutalibacteraceae bacterium]|nr:lactate utilization protein [Acutalibacteraceae bacterium]
MNINKTINSLIKNNINAKYITSRKMLFDTIDEFLFDNCTVGYGGSETLNQLKIKEWLREKNNIKLFDRDISGKRIEDMNNALTSDIFLMSSNAITENGELYNVDGNGNRVAALIYGPKKVIVICGENKIVENLEKAEDRVRTIAAPLNAKRLNKKTPCTITGKCEDCKSPDRICSNVVVSRQQIIKDRINVLILNENLGY